MTDCEYPFCLKYKDHTGFHTLDNKKYKIIYADPAWTYDDKALSGNRGAGCKYDLMTDEALKMMPVSQLADNNCVLFMWATYPKIREALDLVKAWGFEYKTVAFTWVKKTSINTNFMGMGRWTRANAEIVLLGTKGKPSRVDAGIPQIVQTVVKEHSQKPDEVRQRIVKLCGNIPRVELFARTKVYGWDVWGNDEKLQHQQLEGFSQ